MTDDEEQDGADTSILFMTIADEVVAKIQTDYMMDPDFEPLLNQLYKAGICVGIKTRDPNISDAMLSRKIKISKYPVKVLRMKPNENATDVEESIDSGIVSKEGAKELLQSLSLCEKVSESIKNNLIVKIFSLALSFVLSILAVVFSASGMLNSFWIVLFQLFWLIPIIIITKLSIKKYRG